MEYFHGKIVKGHSELRPNASAFSKFKRTGALEYFYKGEESDDAICKEIKKGNKVAIGCIIFLTNLPAV